jgi:hypothetical protein
MGQSDIIEFLEREYYKNSDRKFTKKEIEDGTGKTVKDYSLRTLAKNREIYREVDEEAIKLGHRKYRYRYVPNGNSLIRSLSLRFKGK